MPYSTILEPGFVFREASNEDSAGISELVFNVLKEYGLKPDPNDTDADLLQIFDSYQKQGGFFCLIEKQGRILGCAGIYNLSASKCELRKMYLHPSIRGKGIGKFLLEQMLSKAKELRFSKMTLETASVLKEAISLYKRYGFVKVTTDHLSCRCDQAYELNLNTIS